MRDLYKLRPKPEETLVEGRSSVDVQITCLKFVKRRKTHRTIYLLVPSEVSLRIAGARMSSRVG